MKRLRQRAGAFLIGSLMRELVQLAGDVAERGVQLRAKSLHDRDDRNRDAGGDEAILDGSRARLVLHETRNEGLHG